MHQQLVSPPNSLSSKAAPSFQSVIGSIANANQTRDQRSESRHECTLCLEFQPLNANYEPVDSTFMAITRDVSSSGIGFMDAQPCMHEFVRVSVPHNEATIVAKICYNRPVGDEEPLYLIGAKFISE